MKEQKLTGHEEDLGVHQEAWAQQWPHDQAGCGLEGGHAGCESARVLRTFESDGLKPF